MNKFKKALKNKGYFIPKNIFPYRIYNISVSGNKFKLIGIYQTLESAYNILILRKKLKSVK